MYSLPKSSFEYQMISYAFLATNKPGFNALHGANPVFGGGFNFGAPGNQDVEV